MIAADTLSECSGMKAKFFFKIFLSLIYLLRLKSSRVVYL